MKKIITTAIAIVFIIFGVSLISTASTHAISTDICTQEGISPEIKAANGCDGAGSSTNLSDVVVNVINGAIGILSVVVVIFMIVGGINYMTSAGDPGKIEKAKKTILYAVIGAIICVLAFAITNFVVGALKSADGNNEEEPSIDGGGPVSLVVSPED